MLNVFWILFWLNLKVCLIDKKLSSICGVPLLQVVHSSPTAPESRPSKPRMPSTNRKHCQGWVSVSLSSSCQSLSLLSMAVSCAICTRLHTSQHSPCTVPEMKNTLESDSINSSAFWRPGLNFSMCLSSGDVASIDQIHSVSYFWGYSTEWFLVGKALHFWKGAINSENVKHSWEFWYLNNSFDEEKLLHVMFIFAHVVCIYVDLYFSLFCCLCTCVWDVQICQCLCEILLISVTKMSERDRRMEGWVGMAPCRDCMA